MKFFLDAKKRFSLVAREGGWDLIVDDNQVLYCRTPAEAVRYLGDQLTEESMAEGVDDVVRALASVETAVNQACEVVKLNEAARLIVPILTSLTPELSESRRDHIRDACLTMAGCSLEEFKVRDDRQEIVHKAKIILEPWFEAMEIR